VFFSSGNPPLCRSSGVLPLRIFPRTPLFLLWVLVPAPLFFSKFNCEFINYSLPWNPFPHCRHDTIAFLAPGSSEVLMSPFLSTLSLGFPLFHCSPFYYEKLKFFVCSSSSLTRPTPHFLCHFFLVGFAVTFSFFSRMLFLLSAFFQPPKLPEILTFSSVSILSPTLLDPHARLGKKRILFPLFALLPGVPPGLFTQFGLGSDTDSCSPCSTRNGSGFFSPPLPVYGTTCPSLSASFIYFSLLMVGLQSHRWQLVWVYTFPFPLIPLGRVLFFFSFFPCLPFLSDEIEFFFLGCGLPFFFLFHVVTYLFPLSILLFTNSVVECLADSLLFGPVLCVTWPFWCSSLFASVFSGRIACGIVFRVV